VRWDELDDTIPRDQTPDEVALLSGSTLVASNDSFVLRALSPGRRWAETDPPGGDFQLEIETPTYKGPFGYREFFIQVDALASGQQASWKRLLIRALAATALDGEDPGRLTPLLETPAEIAPLLFAAQGLSLAEHRRFRETEAEGGGRRLVAELALGVILGRWSPDEALAAAGHGHLGLRQLREETHHRGLFPPLGEYVQLLTEAEGPLPIGTPERPESEGAGEARVRAKALHYLRLIAGADADFRAHQWEAIRDLVLRKERVLLVQRTGWGKSSVYFIATKLLREQGAGPTILVSPLLSLMRNQIDMARAASIAAATINYANEAEHRDIYRQIADDELDLLLLTPEWVAKPDFQVNALGGGLENAGLLVIDEVHCISDWGHDFRPDYRRLVDVLAYLDPELPVLGTTATATKRVILDIEEQFGDEFKISRGSLARPGLSFSVFPDVSTAARLAKLLEIIETHEGTGIVYCLTVPETKRVAEWLTSKGIDAREYNAKLDEKEKLSVEQALSASDIKVVVATSALGMGYDKPDIEFVVHFQSPPSVIEYYQQAGRAGRGIPEASAILMLGAEDSAIHEYFFENAFITEQEAEQVLAVLSYDRPLWPQQIEQRVNMSRERIDKSLKLLEIEGAVERGQSGFFKSDTEWSYDKSRPIRVTAQRQLERAGLYEYARSDACRMHFLLEQLDDPEPQDCGECDACTGERFSSPAAEVIATIADELGQAPIWIPPRERAPATAKYKRSWWIRGDLRAAWGRAICNYGETGLGELVQEGREDTGRFDDDLLQAAVEILSDWPSKRPDWISCIPSQDPEDPVAEFSERLAISLGLPFRRALRKTRPTEPQLKMMNDSQRFGNLSFAFEPLPRIPTSPVLLVDDYFYSRWTFAVAAMTLRHPRAGVKDVIPFALARLVR